jgi:hypothetical protein
MIVERRYPRDQIGWLLKALTQQLSISEARLAQHLDLAPDRLADLAECVVPPVASIGFETRVTEIAAQFGVPPWRLSFLCREAARERPRLR